MKKPIKFLIFVFCLIAVATAITIITQRSTEIEKRNARLSIDKQYVYLCKEFVGYKFKEELVGFTDLDAPISLENKIVKWAVILQKDWAKIEKQFSCKFKWSKEKNDFVIDDSDFLEIK